MTTSRPLELLHTDLFEPIEREIGLTISYKSILVVDDQHKPYGLTSLARYDLSQVHTVQHKPRKNSVRGHNLFGAKGHECAEIWCTGHCPVRLGYTTPNQPLLGIPGQPPL
jgi:hypothetical protein